MKSKKQGLVIESQPVLTKIPKSVSIASWHRPKEAASPQKMNCIYLSTLHIQEHCKDSFRSTVRIPSMLYLPCSMGTRQRELHWSFCPAGHLEFRSEQYANTYVWRTLHRPKIVCDFCSDLTDVLFFQVYKPGTLVAPLPDEEKLTYGLSRARPPPHW